MSIKYMFGKEVPTKTLCNRLNELANAVTKGRESINREFYMRIPAEVDNDADLVIGEGADRILRLEKELAEIKECYKRSDEIIDGQAGRIMDLEKDNTELREFKEKTNRIVRLWYSHDMDSSEALISIDEELKLPKAKQEGQS